VLDERVVGAADADAVHEDVGEGVEAVEPD